MPAVTRVPASVATTRAVWLPPPSPSWNACGCGSPPTLRARPGAAAEADGRLAAAGRRPQEVLREVLAEHLRIAQVDRLRAGVDRVAHGVGRHDVRVVALEVRGGEVAGELDVDAVVVQLVTLRPALDPHDADVGLAVPAVAELGHVSCLGRWCSRAG